MAQELLAIGVLEPIAITQRNLNVRDASRRNANFLITQDGGPNYFVKQSHGAGSTYTSNEALFYLYFENLLASIGRPQIMPRLEYFNPKNGLIVTELIDKSETLLTLVRRDASSMRDLFYNLGVNLADLHQNLKKKYAGDGHGLERLSVALPWIMSAHQPPPEMLAILSPPNLEALRIIQMDEGLSCAVEKAREAWVLETVIHCDIKLDNVLVRSEGGAFREPVIVDWELVQIGDPAWDIAGVFQDLLMCWIVASQTVANQDSPCSFTLASVQQLAYLFWLGYISANPSESIDLAKVICFSALRLMQSAYEQQHGTDRMRSSAVLALQVARNMLATPEDAAERLLGLPPGERT